uniref:Mobile element protein n=1 Tax=Klebsiella pneumoniae TaxID=573 RepID=A0A8B0SWN9_KLEPN|nr:Mobile element protein [Klebsiella pneumoniae]
MYYAVFSCGFSQEHAYLRLSVLYLMRWSLPPSQYYAEDRLSFGEPSWKTLRLLVSIWVRTLSIFIVRIIVGRPFTVKKFTRPKLIEFLATCPATTIAMEACGGSHFMARKLEELGHFSKADITAICPPIR